MPSVFLTDIPSLGEQDAEEEEEQGNAGTDPAVKDKRRRLIQQSLILLHLCISYRIAIATRSRAKMAAGGTRNSWVVERFPKVYGRNFQVCCE